MIGITDGQTHVYMPIIFVHHVIQDDDEVSPAILCALTQNVNYYQQLLYLLVQVLLLTLLATSS